MHADKMIPRKTEVQILKMQCRTWLDLFALAGAIVVAAEFLPPIGALLLGFLAGNLGQAELSFLDTRIETIKKLEGKENDKN